MNIFDYFQKIKIDGEKLNGKVIGVNTDVEQTTIYYEFGSAKRTITVETEAVTIG